jgi:tetratricopeptide (TPR) repeat protein
VSLSPLAATNEQLARYYVQPLACGACIPNRLSLRCSLPILCFLIGFGSKGLSLQVRGMPKSGEVDRANGLLQEKTSRAPDDPQIDFLLGSKLLNAGRFQEALQPLQKASGSQRFRVDALQDLGVSLYHLDRLPEAILELKAAIRLKANLPEALYYLISAYRITGQKEHAYKSLERLMQVAPHSAYTYKLMAEAYDQAGNPQKAKLALQQALIRSPKLPGLHFEMGMIYWQLTEYNGAVSEFEQEIRQETNGPFPARSWFYLGDIAMKRLQLQKAVSYLSRSLRLDRNQYDALCELAKAYEGLDRYGDASQALRRAEYLKPEAGTAHWELARVLRKLGQTSQADRELRLFARVNQRRQEDGKSERLRH